MSIFDREGLRTASVRAASNVTALVMTHDNFENLLEEQPKIALALVRKLSVRLHESEKDTIRDLETKNRELATAYSELRAAHEQIVEKERLERELEVARSIQESILPDVLPTLSGFTLGAVMNSARAVGGDLYDFIPLDSNTIGIVIGDVSDKGVPAALYMALTASFMRAEARQGRSPAAVLDRVNEHLLDISDAPMFVTLIYGILEAKTRTFRFARAAHEIPILFDGAQRMQPLPHTSGQPLGILDDPVLDEYSVSIPQGGCLVMFSDGVTEAADEHDRFFGVRGVEQIVKAVQPAHAQELCEVIATAVNDYEYSDIQHDDVTVVAIAA